MNGSVSQALWWFQGLCDAQRADWGACWKLVAAASVICFLSWQQCRSGAMQQRCEMLQLFFSAQDTTTGLCVDNGK